MTRKNELGSYCRESQLLPVKKVRKRWRVVVPDKLAPDLYVCAARYLGTRVKKPEEIECVRDLEKCPVVQFEEKFSHTVVPDRGIVELRKILAAPDGVRKMIANREFMINQGRRS